MPRANRIESYPSVYPQLHAKLIEGVEELILPFKSEQRAKSFRLMWYSYVRALEQSTPPGQRGDAPLLRQFCVALEGDKLRFTNRHLTPENIELLAALESAQITTSSSPRPNAEPTAEELREAQELLLRARGRRTTADIAREWLAKPDPVREPQEPLSSPAKEPLAQTPSTFLGLPIEPNDPALPQEPDET